MTTAQQPATPPVKKEAPADFKPKVFIFAAQDGREGKTTSCKMLIHYLQEELEEQPIIIDADPFNPNVAASYTPELIKHWGAEKDIADKTIQRFLQSKTDSEKDASITEEKKINEILSQQIIFDGRHHLGRKIFALTQFKRDVVVNISGNTYLQLCDFLDSQQAHKSNFFDLWICWVSSGSQESLDLLAKTQKRLDGAKYLLILNEGNSQYVDDWLRYRLPPEIVSLCNEKKLLLASLPLLSIDSTFWYKYQNIPYTKWLKDESIDIFTRDAIRVWIDTACKSIEESGCL